MKTRRPTLRLRTEEEDQLRVLYRKHDVTTDDYVRRPDDLGNFAREWKSRTGRDDSGSDLNHFMITRRKNKKWEKIRVGVTRPDQPCLFQDN
jgi:hypothetical protein